MADDLTKEIPVDQLWVHNESFEKALYNKNAIVPPVKQLTTTPNFHFFGYYDKFQTDPTDRYILSIAVNFEGKTPTPKDCVDIGIIDTQENNKWTKLAASNAWSWQQGCMLQWRPNSTDEIIFNDRQDNKFVTHILNIKTNSCRTIDYPIYHVHPNGKLALGIDFARLQNVRPGYGYAGIPDKNKDILAPKDSSIFLIDLETGKSKPLITCHDIAEITYEDQQPDDDCHWFNCPNFNLDGSRFVFLHRWRSLTGRFKDFRTRMFTANADGSDIKLVTNKPYISHFIWRDNQHIAMWRQDGYKLFKDDASGKETVILKATNGHLSFLKNTDWMIADTYHDKDGNQNPFLFHILTEKVLPLGHFFTPPKYRGGEHRCDLHPRLTRDGKKIIIDSTHQNNGRQMYMIDISQMNLD